MLSVSCPTCGATLGLSDEMVGQQVRCGGCQEVFVVDAPAPSRRPRSRDDEDEERPRRRTPRREDDEEDDRDRPSRRRSQRDDDYDDYEDENDYDDRPLKRRKKRRKRKIAPGKPGLSVAAAILFLIWGGIGAVLTVWSIVGLVWWLDQVGAPASQILSGLVQVVVSGCFSAYLILSGLKILHGQAEDIAAIGTATLSVCGLVMLLSVVRVALVAPRFAFEFALVSALSALVVMSGVIVGGIFCIVCSQKYEKWQAS